MTSHKEKYVGQIRCHFITAGITSGLLTRCGFDLPMIALFLRWYMLQLQKQEKSSTHNSNIKKKKE